MVLRAILLSGFLAFSGCASAWQSSTYIQDIRLGMTPHEVLAALRMDAPPYSRDTTVNSYGTTETWWVGWDWMNGWRGTKEPGTLLIFRDGRLVSISG